MLTLVFLAFIPTCLRTPTNAPQSARRDNFIGGGQDGALGCLDSRTDAGDGNVALGRLGSRTDGDDVDDDDIVDDDDVGVANDDNVDGLNNPSSPASKIAVLSSAPVSFCFARFPHAPHASRQAWSSLP